VAVVPDSRPFLLEEHVAQASGPASPALSLSGSLTGAPRAVLRSSCTTNAANRRGGACISCRGGSELADAGAERGEDGRGRDASGLGEVIAVGAGHLVDQAVGTQQAEFATGPG